MRKPEERSYESSLIRQFLTLIRRQSDLEILIKGLKQRFGTFNLISKQLKLEMTHDSYQRRQFVVSIQPRGKRPFRLAR